MLTIPTRLTVPPWSMAVAAMASVQLGAALSVGVIDEIGAAGTAWLRLTIGAVLFWTIARPRLRTIRRSDLPALLGLGLVTGLATTCFLSAIQRLELGTAVAIEFLGPLTVAAISGASRRALLWPALALLGVTVLTRPWRGAVDLPGLGFAALAAIGWGSYILLTQHVSGRFTGVTALSLTIPIAAAMAAVVGVPQAAGHLTWPIAVMGVGLAVLVPVLPFSLEMLALRRMPSGAFGTLMALEPAFAVLLGLLVLQQVPTGLQVLGTLLVITAGVGAQQPLSALQRRRRPSRTARPRIRRAE